MRLTDCENYEVIISALDDILNTDRDKPWNMSDFDYIVHTLNEHFNCDKVPLADVIVALLNDCNQVITDRETIINVLVKYFGVPKNKINHKERSKIMGGDFSIKKIVKWVVIGLIGLFVVITCINSCSVVEPTERGVTVTLGQVKDVLEPGIHFKAPFVSKVKKYDTTPIPYKKSLGINTDAAVTADKQSIGIDYELYWKYKEDSVKEIAQRYSNKDAIYDPISTALKEIIKDEAGRISIAQFINDQSAVSARVSQRLKERVSYIPVEITQFSITNLDWSDDYDKAIKETARIAQEIERAKNEAEVAAQQAQKKVKEAEAEAQAAEFNKKAAIAKAEGEAESAKIEADATAYKNLKVAQNLSVMQAQWKHEEEMARLEKWDGVQVSSQSVYVPNTYDLKSGK
jgi:regulator of protease activity HflC (stomatin/prohibitin superfamily)